MRATSALHALSATVLLALPLAAHGGQYRGPTTGSGPTGGGTRPGPVTPGPVAGGPITGGEADLDVASWRVWWELNQDRYVARGRPHPVTDAVRVDIVVPSLRKALENANNNPDVGSAALIALGKTGPAADLELLRAGLRRSHQDVREAAVVGLGLSGQAEALQDLQDLAQGTPRGRQLLGRSSTGDRVTAFAAYAMGLFANRSEDPAMKEQVLRSLTALLEARGNTDRDLVTAALNGLRLLAPDLAKGARHKRFLWQATAAVEALLERRVTGTAAETWSHALTALAGLVGRADGADADRARALVLQRLGTRQEDMVYVSCVIALGRMLRPGGDEDGMDLLVQRITRPPSPLVRKFGLIALGEIGGERALDELEKAFRKGSTDDRSWAALGLGILAFGIPASTQGNAAGTARQRVGSLLHDALRKERNRELLAATAIATGLAGHAEAAPDLRAMLDKYLAVETFSGHLCVGLALLGDKPAIPGIEKGMGTADNAVLFAHSALALAHLDRLANSAHAVAVLHDGRVPGPWQLRRFAGAAKAVGHFQNPADVEPLAAILDALGGRGGGSDSLLRTAFAAAALGSVADVDPIGFGARIADGMNYAARAETISNGKNGILDIF